MVSLKDKTCPTQRTPNPRKSTETMVVGAYAFSGSLCGLKLVPAKWRYLVSHASPTREEHPRGCCAIPLKGHNAHPWADVITRRINQDVESI
jgi:hypothetical protein